jgi:hypothetical protein
MDETQPLQQAAVGQRVQGPPSGDEEEGGGKARRRHASSITRQTRNTPAVAAVAGGWAGD